MRTQASARAFLFSGPYTSTGWPGTVSTARVNETIMAARNKFTAGNRQTVPMSLSFQQLSAAVEAPDRLPSVI